MNVLLISCRKLEWMQDSKGTIPVPLLYLAAVLREQGFTPRILDLSVSSPLPGSGNGRWEGDIATVLRNINEFNPSLVGFNCFVSQHFPFIAEASKHIRNSAPDIHITLGGAHPSLFPEDILANCPQLDSIVIGEGEEQITALAMAVAEGNPSRLEQTQALAYRREGRVTVNPRVNYLSDLDDLPEAAWDLINLEDYYSDHSGWHNPKKMDIKLSIPIITSRSCPFNCNFCACHKTMGRTFRKRSPIRIVDEIERLNKDFGMNYFGIIDDNFNIDREHVITICNEIVRRGLDIQFEPTCGLYLGTLDQETVQALAKAGCVFARLPIEHGNEHIRNNIIGKKLTREQIFTAKKLLKESGIRVSTMSIMGFPEETRSTLQDTYDLLIELNADLNYVFNLIPFPGTRVFDQARREGLLLDHFDVESLWRGEADLDPVQHEQQYYLKPKDIGFADMDVYRDMFNRIRVMNPELG